MYFYSQTKNEMSAQHAGTRKWQKIINHEKDTTATTLANYNYNEFTPLNTNFRNNFNISSNNFQISSLYQVF